MQLGFETVGNATVICYDNGPVLVTDPWLQGSAYFGSWALSHTVPEAQMAAIRACPNIWVSHGHPDHLSLESLLPLRDKHIYVSDHVGNRIAAFFAEAGFKTSVLKDRQWVTLSPRIHIQSLAHYNQDSILLVNIDDTLLVNVNDAPSTVWQNYIKRLAAEHDRVILLKWNGFGDAESNFFDAAGKRIAPQGAKRSPIGRNIAKQMKHYGANLALPFSSLHRYQRSDTVWANELLPTLDDYSNGFDPSAGELLPAYISYDLVRDDYKTLPRLAVPEETFSPELFGDDWSETLSKADVVKIRRYFERRPLIGDRLDFVRLVVGGEEHMIRWSSREQTGVTFEVPRGSLMSSVEHEVFDDLFIGNFMKITPHGKVERAGIYPAVNPYLGKWADNGLAESRQEVREYLHEYRSRALLPFLFGRLDDRAKYAIKAHVTRDTVAFDFIRRLRTNVRA
jgi:hypothetical protein